MTFVTFYYVLLRHKGFDLEEIHSEDIQLLLETVEKHRSTLDIKNAQKNKQIKENATLTKRREGVHQLSKEKSNRRQVGFNENPTSQEFLIPGEVKGKA